MIDDMLALTEAMVLRKKKYRAIREPIPVIKLTRPYWRLNTTPH